MKTKKVIIVNKEQVPPDKSGATWGCEKIIYRECKPGETPNGEVADIQDAKTFINGIRTSCQKNSH